MPQYYYDALYCAAFLVVLVVMLGYGRKAFAGSRESFNKVMIGLGFLSTFSIIQLLGNQDLFSQVFFLSERVNRQLVEAIIIVGGLLFLLTGIGGWLPTLRKNRSFQPDHARRYYCLKMIDQASEHNKSIDALLEQAIHYLSLYTGIPRCAAFKYSSRLNTLFLAGAAGFTTRQPEGVRQIAVSDPDLKAALQSRRVIRDTAETRLFHGDRRPDLICPMAHHNRLYGALFCWMDKTSVDTDFIDFMTAVSYSLGRQVAGLVAGTIQKQIREQQELMEEASLECNRATTVQQAIRPLFRLLQRLNGIEFMSLAVLDGSGENMTRYTIGSSGRLLLEKGVSRPTCGTDIEQVFRNGEAIIKADVTSDTGDTEDGLFLSCGMRSKLACPIAAAGKILAVISLGHTEGNHFQDSQILRIQQIAGMMAPVIQRETLRHTLEIRDNHLVRLQKMESDLASGKGLEAFFDDACRILTQQLGCTMARIALFDGEHKNLLSQSCRAIRDTGQALRENEVIPLSLLPWHRLAGGADKLMLINQADPDSRMQPQESAKVLFPQVKSAVLVPINLDGHVQGMISLGEARNWNRRAFGASDLLMVKDIAAKCSLALRMNRFELDARSLRRRFDEATIAPLSQGDLAMQLKSPLTSIMGAVELLQNKGYAGDEFSSRYCSMILNSANRMKDMIAVDGYGSLPAAEESIQSELVIG